MLLNYEALGIKKPQLPEKIIQFGEGNFLRGFTNWMFSRMVDAHLFDGSVVVVQPIKTGRIDALNAQEGLSTLIMRGCKNGVPCEEIEIVKGISRGINPYTHWEDVLKCAENPHISLVISNTTEAGITFTPSDNYNDAPPSSFPGKVLVYLHRRYQFFNGDTAKGLLFLPCELNENNGDLLKTTVLQLAEQWGLDADFIRWIKESNHFLNTLVDRTVPGYPKDEATVLEKKLGYRDGLLNVTEMFHLWVIEDPKGLTECLPFEKGGFNVKRVTDITPYRAVKVRILNGGHTASVPAAFMRGLDTVDEMMRDNVMGKYVRQIILEEIVPSLDGDAAEFEAFAHEVVRRFENPLIKHYLSSILLNSISKYKARVIDSIAAYYTKFKKPPALLSYSFAALIALYQSGEIQGNSLSVPHNGETIVIQDDAQSLAFFADAWKEYKKTPDIKKLTDAVLSNTDLWGRDMTAFDGLPDKVADCLTEILSQQ
jgi:tagaturonate reductase